MKFIITKSNGALASIPTSDHLTAAHLHGNAILYIGETTPTEEQMAELFIPVTESAETAAKKAALLTSFHSIPQGVQDFFEPARQLANNRLARGEFALAADGVATLPVTPELIGIRNAIAAGIRTAFPS